MRTYSRLLGIVAVLAIIGVGAACTAPGPSGIPTETWRIEGTQVTVDDSQDEVCPIVCINREDEPYLIQIAWRVKMGVPGSATAWAVGSALEPDPRSRRRPDRTARRRRPRHGDLPRDPGPRRRTPAEPGEPPRAVRHLHLGRGGGRDLHRRRGERHRDDLPQRHQRGDLPGDRCQHRPRTSWRTRSSRTWAPRSSIFLLQPSVVRPR